MTDNDSSLINEIIKFLKSDRKDILEMAVESALCACSSTRNVQNFLKNKSTVPSLLRLINHEGSVGYRSLACLLHLSSLENTNTTILSDIIEHNGINRLLEIGLSYRNTNDKESGEHVDHAISLLCNITRNNKDGVLELITNDSNVIKMKLLLSRFFCLDYIKIKKQLDVSLEDEEVLSGDDDPYQHVSSILQNITQFEVGCQFLIQHTNTRIPKTIQSIFHEIHTSPNVLRRRNCAGTIKNICMDVSNIQSWFVGINEDELYNNSIANDCDNICYYVLYPLISSTDDYLMYNAEDDVKVIMHEFIILMEAIDKVREVDTSTRLTLIQTILILCTCGRNIREALRSYGTYYILKNVDMQEDDEDVSNQISDCVQFLRRDEDGMPQGSSDVVALEIARERRKKESELEEQFNHVD